MSNNYITRNTEKFLRNGFKHTGNYDIPLIKRQEIELADIKLMACSNTKSNESEAYKKCGVHFYVDDFRFNNVFENPEKSLSKYSQYRFLLSPDFSLYAEMPIWLQQENVAKNRWCGAFWQSKGLTVIPTISWSTSRSFAFCFDGVQQNSVVSVGMIGCKGNKLNFLRGYDKMLERLNPKGIICYGTPFKEMQGNIICVPYAHTRKEVL